MTPPVYQHTRDRWTFARSSSSSPHARADARLAPHGPDAHAWEIIPTPRARAQRVHRRDRRAERRGHGAVARDRVERAIGDDADARDDRGGGGRRWISRCVARDGMVFVRRVRARGWRARWSRAMLRARTRARV